MRISLSAGMSVAEGGRGVIIKISGSERDVLLAQGCCWDPDWRRRKTHTHLLSKSLAQRDVEREKDVVKTGWGIFNTSLNLIFFIFF